MNRSIMYWKWDNDVLDPEVMDKKLNDLTSRTQIGSIFIGTQWIVDHFHGEKIGAAFRRCIDDRRSFPRRKDRRGVPQVHRRIARGRQKGDDRMLHPQRRGTLL